MLLAAMVLPFAVNAQSNATTHVDTTIVTCNSSFTWTVNGVTYTESGAYTYFQGDKLYILDLTLNPSYNVTVEEPIACGCTYMWGDTMRTQSGTYTHKFQTVNGCDSMVTVTLAFSNTSSKEYTVTACSTYTWKGTEYDASGNYTVTDTAGTCDSTLTLHLTVITPYQASYDTTISGCESIRYRFIPTSGYFTIRRDIDTNTDVFSQTNAAARGIFHPRTAARCFDSTTYIHFRIKNKQENRVDTAVCDNFSLTINNTEYNYTYTRLDTIKAPKAANGCDSLVIVNVTINKSPVATISGDLRVKPNSDATLTASCNQTVNYLWYNGQTTTSITIPNVNGNIDVSLTATNPRTGCSSETFVTVMANVGIDDVDGAELILYPNPTTAAVSIATEEMVKSVSVYNLNGQRVMQLGSVERVDLQELANGTYLIRIELGNGQTATRTVVLSK